VIRRRAFVALLGGAAVWPLGAHAQQQNDMRRIGVFVAREDEQEITKLFVGPLAKLGWIEGRNVHIDYRTYSSSPESLRTAAAELIASHPDVIFTVGVGFVAVRAQTQTIPIVFVRVSAPIERSFVASLARPGGNVTGFANFAPSVAGKWLGLLKEVAPKLARSATIFDPDVAPHAPAFLHSVEAASRTMGMETTAAPVRTDAEVESVLASLAGHTDGALLVIPDTFTVAHRQVIIRLAETYRVPAIYPFQVFAHDGGLMAYSDDIADQYRGAATYVDRILKGTKPADLPVQEPSKYQFVINLKTARTLGLNVPLGLTAAADEVID
jgi:putative ABC transport system substrate-binding protein